MDNVFGEINNAINYKLREAVYAMAVNEHNEIALIKTPRGLFLPGGGIEANETHEKCLERELLEETGFIVVIGDYLGTSTLFHYAPKQKEYFKMVGHYYYSKINHKAKEKKDKDHDLVWINMNEAINEVKLDHQRWAIKKVEENNRMNKNNS